MDPLETHVSAAPQVRRSRGRLVLALLAILAAAAGAFALTRDESATDSLAPADPADALPAEDGLPVPPPEGELVPEEGGTPPVEPESELQPTPDDVYPI